MRGLWDGPWWPVSVADWRKTTRVDRVKRRRTNARTYTVRTSKETGWRYRYMRFWIEVHSSVSCNRQQRHLRIRIDVTPQSGYMFMYYNSFPWVNLVGPKVFMPGHLLIPRRLGLPPCTRRVSRVFPVLDLPLRALGTPTIDIRYTYIVLKFKFRIEFFC